MISLIIPSKKLDDYLLNSLSNYKKTFNFNYEIIVVHEKCTEEVYEKFSSNFKKDKSITFLLNPSKGRINALNFGYLNSKGDIIKCIDSDDIILKEYFENLEVMKNYPAHCHNANLIDNNNEIIGNYNFDSNFLFKNYDYVLTNLKSHPRWVWSFQREIADQIFPIPSKLFAEDIWFSLIIKKYSKKILHINSNVYLYRQHSEGEWGGLKNFSKEVMTRRAKWNLSLIPILLEHNDKLGIFQDDILTNIINYYKVLLSKKSISKILFAKTTNFYKTKLFIIIFFPSIASILIQFKWNFSNLKINYINYYNKIRKKRVL